MMYTPFYVYRRCSTSHDWHEYCGKSQEIASGAVDGLLIEPDVDRADISALTSAAHQVEDTYFDASRQDPDLLPDVYATWTRLVEGYLADRYRE